MTLANYKNLPTATHGHLPAFPDLTKTETLVYFDELIQKYELQYVLHQEVSKVIREGEKFRLLVNQEEVTADFVGIGIGILGRPNKPKYKIPVSLRKSALFDLTSVPVKEAKVLVVGGGDTSSEYCQILVEEACQVSLAIRGAEITRMMDSNLEAVQKLSSAGRLDLRMNCDIQELLDEGAKPKVIFADGQIEIFDFVIYAIGGTTPVNFLKTIGIEFNEKDWPVSDENGETNIPNLFLLGDLVAGKTGGSIITAYNASFRSAQEICKRAL